MSLQRQCRHPAFTCRPRQTRPSSLQIGMTTGATIHTTNGLYMYVKERGAAASGSSGVAGGKQLAAA